MLCEACNGCSVYFLASLVEILLVKTVLAGFHLKLSMPVILKADLNCNRFGRRPQRFVARPLNFTFTLGRCGRFES